MCVYMNKNKLTVCYFGNYNPNYSRNRVLINGLKENKIKVIECNQREKRWKYIKLFLQHWKIRNNYDLIIVGFPGHTVIWLAKLISKKPVIFDAFLSLYDSLVFDRKVYSNKSFKAKYYYFLDWLSCKLADKILLDTKSHINYFIDTFGIRRTKFDYIYIGTTPNIFYPYAKKKEKNTFVVHFHGTGIPLQGIEYILDSAKELEKFPEIKFNIIGNVQTLSAIRERINRYKFKNVNFIKPISIEKLADYINASDIVLGIFGTTEKAKRVIPNKIFEGLACAKPIITSKTPAIEELLTNKKNCLLTKPGDPSDLSNKILELKNNPILREKLAQNGYQLFKKKLTPKILGSKLKKIIYENYLHCQCQNPN